MEDRLEYLTIVSSSTMYAIGGKLVGSECKVAVACSPGRARARVSGPGARGADWPVATWSPLGVMQTVPVAAGTNQVHCSAATAPLATFLGVKIKYWILQGQRTERSGIYNWTHTELKRYKHRSDSFSPALQLESRFVPRAGRRRQRLFSGTASFPRVECRPR